MRVYPRLIRARGEAGLLRFNGGLGLPRLSFKHIELTDRGLRLSLGLRSLRPKLIAGG